MQGKEKYSLSGRYISGVVQHIAFISFLLACTSFAAISQCVTSVVNPSCPGSADGSITALFSDDFTGNKKYELYSNSAILDSAVSLDAHSFTGLPADIYETKIYLPDSSGGWNYQCNAVDTVVNPDTLEVTTAKTNIGCRGDSTGSIQVNVSGGTKPYYYLWTNGKTTDNLTGLPAGTYAVVITDIRGCLVNKTFTLTQPSTAISSSYTTKDIKCHGQATGSVDLTVNGGSPPYTFSWNNGSTTEDLSNIRGGSYTVVISDTSQCQDQQVVEVKEPPKFVAGAKGINISCNGLTDGKAAVNGSGGTPPYTYLWTTGETSDTIKGLEAGKYTVIALDSNNCVSSGEAFVIEPKILNAVIRSEAPDCDRVEYDVELLVDGGTNPYSFQWSNGSTDKNQPEMEPGDYTVTISDGGTCTIVDSLSLEFVEATCVNIPGGFTPNGDGTNDTWVVRNFEKYPDAFLQVFDIQGRIVFDSKTDPYPWTGRKDGEYLPIGTYYYIMDLNDGSKRKTGPVTILR